MIRAQTFRPGARMIELIGDGGHAAVIRDLIAVCDRLNKNICLDGTIIAVGNNRHRQREVLNRGNISYATLIHHSATVAASADIGPGTVIMAGAVVQARAKIGAHCILNTCCSVDHDCVVDDFVHVAPGAHLCGTVKVGKGAMVGTGVCVAQNATLTPWTLYKSRRLDPCPMP